jgi:hypothetical protein
MRLAAGALLAPSTLLLLAACSGTPRPRQLGEYAVLAPRLAVVDSERPPINLTVDLSAPASVVVMYVAPGRSTRIVYPADTLGAPPLPAGSHRIAATWPRPPADTARRDADRTSRQQPPVQPRSRRDSISRAGVPRTGTFGLSDPEAGLAPTGYLLLIATPARLSYPAVRRKVEGVTTPLDADEALNAIAKQVLATLEPGVQWSGYAVEVTVRPDDARLPRPARSTR